MDKVDCIVIGAGVIGLAVARAMALRGREVFVLEAHKTIGMETSSRNSEVIHAGIYYPVNSLKARFCVEGRKALYMYCEERGIPYQRCGKLIVATKDADIGRLTEIYTQAQVNGCSEVTRVTAREAQLLEPDIFCVAALFSPMTGILDTHAYLTALQSDAENTGAAFSFGSRVVSGVCDTEGIVLQVETGMHTDFELQADKVINCAGLWAPYFARQIAGLEQSTIPKAYFAKGNYFAFSGKAPFSHLVYPVPETGGLGVHLTLDLGGNTRFGPDVEWLEDIEHENDIDYTVDPQRVNQFYPAIRAYWPHLPDGALMPAYAGVRPKISSSQAPVQDFLLASHGSPHYMGLYGIESPGLTASLAIADYVVYSK